MTATTDTRPETVEDRVAERFPQDVDGHVMRVVQDDGLHRHIRFGKPDTSMGWFELITWPGSLVINGDMGTYAFSRTVDMFAFFGPDRRVNLTYWGEKVRQGPHSTRDGVQEYAASAVRELVNDHVEEWIASEDLGPNAAAGLRAAAKEQILDRIDDHDETAARELLEQFEHGDFGFSDVWEYSLTEWVYQFVWCCHAITWGIGRYLNAGGQIVTNADYFPDGQTAPTPKVEILSRAIVALLEDVTVEAGISEGSDLRRRLDAWICDPLAEARSETRVDTPAPSPAVVDGGTSL